MKKIILIITTISIILVGSLNVCAEDIPDTVVSVETEETTAVQAPSETVTENYADYEKYSEQFVDYIFSGASGSDELMDKIIAMGEQYQASKEAGYTLEERIAQLVTTENIITTVAAAFLFVCGIAFFIVEKKRKSDARNISAYVVKLEDKYSKEVEANAALKEQIGKMCEAVEETNRLVLELHQRSDVSKEDMDKVVRSSKGVANMVKNVFLNSKTIDANGKSLLIHDYLETVEADKIAIEKGEKNE